MSRILAIDPGTKEIGTAVLDNGELIYYAVKTVRDRSTARRILQQASETIAQLIDSYKPQVLAIEKMFIVQKSAALLSVVAEEIKTIARVHELQVFEYSPSAIRKFICDSGRATKSDLAAIVAQRFPELARHLQSRTKWETKYYANIFDAIGVGLRCQSDITNQPLPF
jgi:Holliday junction resolvasome RuvABC endonuclease subunit